MNPLVSPSIFTTTGPTEAPIFGPPDRQETPTGMGPQK